MMNLKYMKIASFAIPVILITASCSQDKSTKQVTGNHKPSTAAQIELVQAVNNQPNYVLDLPGELQPFEQVDLYPKVKGFVKKILVDRGSRVKKGQLLVILEAPEVSQKYLSEKSAENKYYEDYLYSRQSYERFKKAASKVGSVAEIEIDKARSKFKSDSAAYASAKANTGISAQQREYLRITAPFDGIIVDKNVSNGALVGDNSQVPLITIVQTNQLRLTVAIPEKHSQSLSKNTQVTFTVSNLPGKVYQSRLSRKSDFVKQESRAINAEFDVSNSGNELRGGEYARVKLNLSRPYQTLWLPIGSIIKSQSGIFINKVNQGKIERIEVTLGNQQGKLQEVFGEITTDDQIVKVGSEELTNGINVTIKK
ncbi:efflux RND transporter periplasmic adaptor subunit [Pedobacter immunditicola]|uniref:efflux RND transporter periplasmic adaptor subunit n=1 Tax=Pedobacter immunditicola TaxID=3133440 RepID=UPI00309C2FAD